MRRASRRGSACIAVRRRSAISARRSASNYTAIGDGINLTSRLEALNKHYGTTIIASETIYEAAKEDFDFRLLDRVAVKGKMQGITIYDCSVRERTAKRVHMQLSVTRKPSLSTSKALSTARFRCWRNSRTIHRVSSCSPAVAEFIETPPPAWDGVYGFTSK